VKTTIGYKRAAAEFGNRKFSAALGKKQIVYHYYYQSRTNCRLQKQHLAF
jgi:hypothetical protein